MSLFPPLDETWMVTLECGGNLPGPRFLDGRVQDGSVGLAPNTDSPFTGTWWAVTTLSPGIVKFRCMTQVQGPRLLDGRVQEGSVGLAPMLAIPLSGERWRVTEDQDARTLAGVVTLECLGDLGRPEFRFLDGRTLESAVGLAPNTDPPFTGTHWIVVVHGRIVALECQGRGSGYRFLDGRLLDGTVALAPTPLGRFTGARWLLQEAGGTVTLKCLGELEGNYRFLDGVLLEKRVGLARSTEPPFTGTHWQMTKIPNPHSDVEPGFLATFRCLGAVESEFRFLDGVLAKRAVGLAPNTDPPFTGTLWRVLPAGLYWEPCPRFHEQPNPYQSVQVIRTVRVGQITGSHDPEGRPLINGDTAVWFGVPGVDLGANTEDGHGRLFIFFGDVVRGNRPDGPVVDADLVAFTVDIVVDEPGGIRLNPVVAGKYFDPFRVEGPSGIGVTPTFEVASGAFSHAGKVFVFFHIWDSVPRNPKPIEGCYLASKSVPGQPGPFTEVCLFSPRPRAGGGFGADSFAGVAPVKVRNADHTWLPENAAELSEEGIVMFGIGVNPSFQYSGIHLAWMPLTSDGPNLEEIRYYTGGPQRWDRSLDNIVALFGKQTNLQSISAGYLTGPKKWIVLHMTANDTNCITGPIVARIGTPPFSGSEEFRLFDPCREQAYGRYMHWPDLDTIQLEDPFRAPPTTEQERLAMEQDRRDRGPGSAYGAFLLERFTRWEHETGELDLYYLLSLGSPYQVQVMHTTLRVDGRELRARTKIAVEPRLEIHGKTPF